MTNAKPLKDLPYANKGDLTTGPVGKHLVNLTLPMIWGIFAVISVQIADTYFISLLGTQKLAAISFTFPVIMILTHMTFGVNIAMASVVSRLIGAGKMEDVRRVTLHGLMFAALVSMVIGGLCYIFHDPLFRMLGADETTLPIIREYMPIWLIAFMFLAIPSCGNSAIRATGDAKWPALVMTVIAVSNLILAPILVFGKFGMPELGVKGAAIGTLTAYILGTALGLYVMIRKKNLLPRDGLHMDKFGDSMKRLAFIALPAGITNIMMPATNAVIVALLATYGTEAVAAYGIAGRIEAFAMVIIIAMATSMAPIIGQNWGAGIYSRVHKTINLAIKFNVIWSFAMAAVLAVFARPIAEIFSHDPVVVDYAALFFRIVPVTYAFGNLVFGWASSFNAIGKPQLAFAIILVKSLVMMVPAVYLGSHIYGATGVFCAIATVNVVAGTLFHVLSWRRCKTYEHEKEQA